MTNKQCRRLGAVLLMGAAVSLTTTADETQATKEEQKVQFVELSTAEAQKRSEPKVVQDQALWQKSTGGDYPDLANTELKIVANITDQRIYFYDRDKLIYTMVTSSGLAEGDNATPLGEFEIQEIRGESFFNSELNEGALNYVSFKDNGVYLFHSVPVNQELEVNVTEAEKLGQRASHGCFRLSMPDSKWFYENVPGGTPVKVTE